MSASPITLPRTAAAQSALAEQVQYHAREHGVEEAINMVARDIQENSGGDIFWALAHVGAAHRNALTLGRQPSFEDACEAQLSFGS